MLSFFHRLEHNPIFVASFIYNLQLILGSHTQSSIAHCTTALSRDKKIIKKTPKTCSENAVQHGYILQFKQNHIQQFYIARMEVFF